MSIKPDQPMLVIEDSPEDYEATIRFFQKSGVPNPCFHCEDGDEALDFLFHQGDYQDPVAAPRPGIILLDLNLPGADGREILAEVKRDQELKAIPVLVFSSSNLEEDIKACYQAGANSYVKKPVELDEFNRTLQRVKEFWFDTAIIPETSSSSQGVSDKRST